MIDFSGDKLSTDLLDKLISGIRAIDNNHFEWTVNISPDRANTVRCIVGGRKTSPTAEIEGESPLTYTFCFIDSEAIKNTFRGMALHRLLSLIRTNFGFAEIAI